MASHHHVNNAKAILGLLVLGIAFVLFYKFVTNQETFLADPEALRNYVLFTVVACGFLIGILYLASHTTHKETSSSKVTAKATKKKKK